MSRQKLLAQVMGSLLLTLFISILVESGRYSQALASVAMQSAATPTPAAKQTYSPLPSSTRKATSIALAKISIKVEETESVTAEDLQELTQMVPKEWLAPSPRQARYVMKLVPSTTEIERCQYQPMGTVVRLKVDADVIFTDQVSGQQLSVQRVFGNYPESCRMFEEFNLGLGKRLLGLPNSLEFKRSIFALVAAFTDLSVSDGANILYTIGYLAFSPDERFLAVGSYDFSVKLVDLSAGQIAHVLMGHKAPVWRVAFSADGKTIASASRDGVIIFWDAEKGKSIRTISVTAPLTTIWAPLSLLVFAPDLKTVAVGTEQIELWDLSTGKQTQVIKTQPDTLLALAFSPDGKTLATGSDKATVKLWDITTGKQIRAFTDSMDAASLAFSPSSKLVAVGERSSLLKIVEADTGDLHFEPDYDKYDGLDDAFQNAFSPNEQTFASGNWRGIVKLWQVKSGVEIHTFLTPADDADWATSLITGLAFSPTGTMLAAGDWGGEIVVWKVETRQELFRFKNTLHSLKQQN